ncbi:MAG: cytochrome c biogenesis CcdA family protein [Mycobacterium sp.]
MNQGLIGLAFAAGLVAAVNPCGFAMLPGYLVLVVRGQPSGERTGPLGRVGRALGATAGMALGFVTVFGLFGALTISAGTTVQRYLPYVTAVIGVVLVALGFWLLSGRELTTVTPRPLGPRWAPTARRGSAAIGMYGYGVSYAIASLSCTIAPFLAVTAAGFRGGSIATGVLIYLAYVAGLTLVVGVLAIAAATASSALAGLLRRTLPLVNRIGGVLLILVGLYVGYYGLYELRLLNADANPQDAVITAAGRLQGALAGWVHQHGLWPWVVGLSVLVLGALAAAWRRRARSRRPASAASRAGGPTSRESERQG